MNRMGAEKKLNPNEYARELQMQIDYKKRAQEEKRIAKDVQKTLNSAVANAENNFQYDIDNLIVKEAYCGKKIVMKRFRPRAKGRAAPILKPWSSVTIILSETKNLESHGTKS